MSIDTKALKERIYALEADLGTAQHADHEETIRELVVAADRLAALEAELARVRELAAKWRAAPQDPDEPLLAMAADELEAALPQDGESLPLMARREWMGDSTDYFVVHGDFCLEVESFRGTAPRYAADGSLIVVGDSAECDQVDAEAQPDGTYRIADTDEHGLPVIPRTADMPEMAKYRAKDRIDKFAYYSFLPTWARFDAVAWARIEDFNEHAQRGQEG